MPAKTVERAGKTEFPDLIERKILPEYRRVRARIAEAGVKGAAREADFLLGQLDGSDFVNVWGALWALNSIERLKPAQKDALYSKASSRLGHERWQVQEAAAEALGATDSRAEAPLLGAYGQRKRMYCVKQAAARSLARIGSVDRLLELSRDADELTSVPAVEALGLAGKAAIPHLEGIARSASPPNPRVYAAYVSLARNPGYLPVLAKTAQDNGSEYRFYAVKALGGMGADAVPALAPLALGEPSELRDEAVESLGRIGEPAYGVLEKAYKSARDLHSRNVTASALCMTGPKARGLLAGLDGAGVDMYVRSVAVDGLRLMGYDREDITRKLIYSEEPAFATPYFISSERMLSDLADISRRLREKYAGYVGVIGVGSSALGYLEDDPAQRVSDFDYGLVCDGPEAERAVAEFKRLAKARKIRADPACQSGEVYGLLGDGNSDMLFRGLFFGDRGRLMARQRRALLEAGPERWDEMRESMLLRTDYRKLRRFGFREEEVSRIELLRSVLWTPPDYETMKVELVV